ncbi:glycoside hydrolase family 16 protein [uncultured Arthrobacter sp.]|uniref:glycoside hydrolase family 16 protein n=1 Tax=uncultured Arthrobacter sp. TaxID=114050 RepID=UPI0026013993|nr:family 16 glycosylhydrolase [uncultured Arthrobacter sp.]
MRARIVVLIIVLFAATYALVGFVSDSLPGGSSNEEARDRPRAASTSLEPTADRLDDISAATSAMPVGDLPGWRQIFTEDFTDGDVAIGEFPGWNYSARWSANYRDGTPDTAAQTLETMSGYYPSKVLSVHDGVLDMYLHTEDGISMGAAPSPRFEKGGKRPYNSQTYGRYSVRFKADELKGFKLAWLLWPDSKQWPEDGEIDFPEGDLSKTIYAALHGPGDDVTMLDQFRTKATFTSWHIATIEWSPDRVQFFLDGKLIGTSRSAIPDTPMHYILQTESCLTTCPHPDTRGHVYVDWVAIWARD